MLHFIFFLFSISTVNGGAAVVNRRVLHQPFFPVDSQPPSQPPSSPTTTIPKYPFDSSVPNNPDNNTPPFFPTFPSPPPPPQSPSSLDSFPANISSLDLPQNSKSKSASSKLIATAIACVVAAVIVLSIVVFLHLHKRKSRRYSTTESKTTQRSENSPQLNNSNANSSAGTNSNSNSNSNRNIPKLQRPSQTSSEFLYLGTLVSSHGGIDTNNLQNRPNSAPVSRKMDSPELRPLPPLQGQGHGGLRQQNYGNNNIGSGGGTEYDEEFYSPRESLGGGRESSIGTGTGSDSRRAFAAVEVEKFVGSSSCSSYSSSSSGSDSPVRSVSLSISPPASLSPKTLRSKIPEFVAVEIPLRPPPPPPLPLTMLVNENESLSSSTPRSSSSPERFSSRSTDSSPRISNIWDQNVDFGNPPQPPPPPPRRLAISVPARQPPPPPPPPPSRNWDSPRTPTPPLSKPLSKPPVLITPLRPMSIESPVLISPMELPSKSEHIDKNGSHSIENVEKDEETPKPKLKTLHWDKVRASSDREMVWDQLKSSSFKLDEEMMESLFVVKTPNSNTNGAAKRPVLPSPRQENSVLDPKKSQNIAILLRALHVTIEEVCEALLEGNAETLGTELLESLLKMAPSKEEERKLKEYKDDSPFKLGPAEKFLKAVLDIPFAFKRVDAMLYISNFDSEVDYLKKSFETLEGACEELRSSRMFLKLLEAVLKTGNRMNVGTNRGDAHAFKLVTLLKLVDIKGADGKTTLLHFVVQEIIRSEGARLSTENQIQPSTINDDVKCRKLGLQVVSKLSSELINVKKAAAMDSEVLHSDVLKLSKGIANIAEVVRSNEAIGLEQNSIERFSESMNRFMNIAEEEIFRLQAQESLALSLVKEITEYFHGDSAREEAHPFRIFMVVRDFLMILDRVCKEVGTINEQTIVSSSHKFPVPVNPNLQPVINGFTARRQHSSSDEESSSSP